MTTPRDIYAAYPRKVAPKAAIKSIEKALDYIGRLDGAEWLLKRVQLYAECMIGKERRFIPHPTTWFNQGRYDDDEAEWMAQSGDQVLPTDHAPPLPHADEARIGLLGLTDQQLERAYQKYAKGPVLPPLPIGGWGNVRCQEVWAAHLKLEASR